MVAARGLMFENAAIDVLLLLLAVQPATVGVEPPDDEMAPGESVELGDDADEPLTTSTESDDDEACVRLTLVCGESDSDFNVCDCGCDSGKTDGADAVPAAAATPVLLLFSMRRRNSSISVFNSEIWMELLRMCRDCRFCMDMMHFSWEWERIRE